MASKSYESLMGAIGRSVFYRPERQRVRELLSRDANPRLLVNGSEYSLFDISMNGVSFLANGNRVSWRVGGETELSLLLNGEEVYRGNARVARAEPGPGTSTRVGLGLTTGFLDLPDIRRRDDEKQLERDLADGPEPRRILVPDEYRSILSKIAHFLAFYKRVLSSHERRYRSEGRGDAGALALAEKAYPAMLPTWRQLQQGASTAALACLENPDVLRASKEYTETVVTPLVLDSPIGFRSFTKPFGYPGDYKVMLYYYENRFEGESAYGKVIHKFYVEDYPLGAGVRTRKDLMVRFMEEEHRRVLATDGDTPVFRVVNLGCGPAREVSSFVSQNRNWPGKIIWTLIDQEEEALSVAYRESRSEISRWGAHGQLNLLNLSFAQMLCEGLPIREPGSQHFIFATGLFDYIREKRAQTLILSLYDLLADGGLLTIGNAIAPNQLFWATEFLVDWTLLFRTRDEMLNLAALLPDTAKIDVDVEPSNAYYFLKIRKN